MPGRGTAVLGDAMDGPVDDADLRTLAAFRRELRLFLQFSEAAASARGLAPQQHQALLAIRAAENRNMTVGELAEALLLRHHSASGLVSRLEKLGMVRRQGAGEDRRQRIVSLTDEAEALLLVLSNAHREELRRVRPLLVRLLKDL